jgi:hypothetical protein
MAHIAINNPILQDEKSAIMQYQLSWLQPRQRKASLEKGKQA